STAPAGLSTGIAFTLLHQQLGLKVQSRGSAALFEFWSLLESNELKIFASLSMFLEEYRIGEYQSPLLLCAQMLVSRPDLLESKEAEPDDDEYWRGTSSPFLGRALGCVDGLPGTFGDEQTGTCGARPQKISAARRANIFAAIENSSEPTQMLA